MNGMSLISLQGQPALPSMPPARSSVQQLMISSTRPLRREENLFGARGVRLWTSTLIPGLRYLPYLLDPGDPDQKHTSPAPLRLAIILCLQGKFNQLLVSLGTVCSSWVGVSRGSTKRGYATPAGCTEHPAVRCGNLMVARNLV